MLLWMKITLHANYHVSVGIKQNAGNCMPHGKLHLTRILDKIWSHFIEKLRDKIKETELTKSYDIIVFEKMNDFIECIDSAALLIFRLILVWFRGSTDCPGYLGSLLDFHSMYLHPCDFFREFSKHAPFQKIVNMFCNRH